MWQGVMLMLLLLPQGGEKKPGGKPEGEARKRENSSATQSARATPLRNENRQINAYDTEAEKERLSREGYSIQYLESLDPSRESFGAEYGVPPPSPLRLTPRPSRDVHWEFFWFHQNSVFNARNFFQVGDVQPARTNWYGGSWSGNVAPALAMVVTAEQRKARGFVNGNVLVPLPNERTPRSGDAETDAILRGFLKGFPRQVPNLPWVSPRSLNTNARQDSDQTEASTFWQYTVRPESRLLIRYAFDDTFIDAFQLVAGENTDTRIRRQSFAATLHHNHSPASTSQLSFQFRRKKTLLTSPDGAVGPTVKFSEAFTQLGPEVQFPLLRYENVFGILYGFARGGSKHDWHWGVEAFRNQINDSVGSFTRGEFIFQEDFGHSAVENFLVGAPSRYNVTLGNVHRGFRNWDGVAYGNHSYLLTPALRLTVGVRWELATRPREVHGWTQLPYGHDSNVGPTLGLAWRLGRGTALRAGYGLLYDKISQGTYQAARFNPPRIRNVVVNRPSLKDPLAGIDLQSLTRSSRRLVSPDLTSPYTHYYTLALETELPWALEARLAYIGGRTFKLILDDNGNRARPVPGIPWTTKTINERRPDQNSFRVKRIVNMGNGYLDAFQGRVSRRFQSHMGFEATYTISKALDTGANLLSTGFGKPLYSQTQGEIHRDMKGPSDFDVPQTMELHYVVETPGFPGSWKWLSRALSQWQIRGTVLFKSGTPFTVYTGSDAPGLGNVDGEDGDRPNLLSTSLLGKSFADPDTSSQLLRTGAFNTSVPVEGAGTLGRNTFRKDGANNFNLSLSKPLLGRDGSLLRFQADFFNLLNHAQFDAPGFTLTNDDFGLITNTVNSGRVAQFSLRLTF
ncbi:MAG: hypothetical protein HY652_10610 [Acidobacteria bacterium]|nr:hypothetical protein [Acidobacteriota bacterium]